TVNQRQITVDSVNAQDRIYDGTDKAVMESFQLGNTVNGDVIGISAANGAFNSKNATDNNGATSATFSGITLTGADMENYLLVDGSGNTVTQSTSYTDDQVLIERKELKVWIDDAEKIYGSADPTFNWIADGLCTDVNETVTDITRQAGENTGDYAIDQFKVRDAADADVTGNYDLVEFRAGTLTIKPATIPVESFTVTGLEKIYDGDAYVEDTATLTFSFVNSLTGNTETVTVNWTEGYFNSKNVGEDTQVTFVGLSSPDGNFVLTNAEATFQVSGSITPLQLTHNVTIETTKVYDGTTDVAVSGGLTNVIGSDDVTLNVEYQYNSANAAEANQITNTKWFISGADSKNYILPTPAPMETVAATITAKAVNTVWVTDQPYQYENKDQSGTVSAYYVDIYGNQVDLALDWHGKVFDLPGDYVVTALNSDANYKLVGSEIVLTMKTVGVINVTNFSEGLNPNYSSVMHDMLNSYLASGRNTYADDACYSNMGYSCMISRLFLFRETVTTDFTRTTLDAYEFKPFTLDAVTRDIASGVAAGAHRPEGLFCGEEIFLQESGRNANDMLINIQQDMDADKAHLIIESDLVHPESAGEVSVNAAEAETKSSDADEMPDVKLFCPVAEKNGMFCDEFEEVMNELLNITLA
ncbi:MAG: hypothetical protein J6Q65_07115, partial [Lentisphaeria bacterium]|nr:hypothetical protein [Lentisphaeria bacterium]